MGLPIQPNLFLIGGMRCGSTTLHLMLGQHPDIYMSPVKEPYFYVAEAMRRKLSAGNTTDPEAIRHLNEYVKQGKYRTVEKYATLFNGARHEKYIGESSHYLYHPEAASVIFEDCPNSRIIVSIRNPVERLYSEYLLYRRNGQVKKSFEEFALEGCEFNEFGELIAITPPSKIPKGLYHRLLREWLRIFGPNQVKIVLYDDLVRDPVKVCQSIFEWLGIDSTFVPVQVRSQPGGIPRTSLLTRLDHSPALRPVKALFKRILPDITRQRLRPFVYRHLTTRPRIDPDLRSRLMAIYREDIENLETLLNLDLSSWK